MLEIGWGGGCVWVTAFVVGFVDVRIFGDWESFLLGGVDALCRNSTRLQFHRPFAPLVRWNVFATNGLRVLRVNLIGGHGAGVKSGARNRGS